MQIPPFPKRSPEGAEREVVRPLSDRGDYPCPICRHGRVAPMPLMETAMACDFCRHLFTAQFSAQILRVEDSAQPLSWQWGGRSWQPVRPGTWATLTPTLWVAAAVLAVLPATIIALAQYIFPPLPDSRGSALGPWWLALTAIAHFCLVSWVLLEHYQLASYVSLKLRLQGWRDRLAAYFNP